MKMYVDELPKNCIDCPCESEGFCNLIPLDYCYGTPPKDCPLQSLADHDKQVRKQVCDEIYKVLTNEDVWRAFKKGWWLNNGDCKQLRDILDQIEKGEINENR